MMSLFTYHYVIFHKARDSHGEDAGWYYRLRSSLDNEPVGPYENKHQAKTAADAAAKLERGADG